MTPLCYDPIIFHGYILLYKRLLRLLPQPDLQLTVYILLWILLETLHVGNKYILKCVASGRPLILYDDFLQKSCKTSKFWKGLHAYSEGHLSFWPKRYLSSHSYHIITALKVESIQTQKTNRSPMTGVATIVKYYQQSHRLFEQVLLLSYSVKMAALQYTCKQRQVTQWCITWFLKKIFFWKKVFVVIVLQFRGLY